MYNIFLESKKEIKLFFYIFYKNYKILFIKDIKKKFYLNKLKHNKKNLSIFKIFYNSFCYIKFNITLKFFLFLNSFIIKLKKNVSDVNFDITNTLMISNHLILDSCLKYNFFNKNYNIILFDKLTNYVNENYYAWINDVLINESYKLKVKIYKFVDYKLYNLKNNFNLKIKKELINLDWFLTLITLKNAIKKNNRLKTINNDILHDIISLENYNKNNSFVNKKNFLHDCKIKLIALFIKKGLKSKALFIWSNIIKHLNYKLLLNNKINNFINFDINYILHKSISNIIPLAVFKYRNNISKSLNLNVLPCMILRANNSKFINLLKLKSKKKKLLNLHEKIALQWIINAASLLINTKKKEKTIEVSISIASLLWDTAFFNDSKIVEIKKNYYKHFYNDKNNKFIA